MGVLSPMLARMNIKTLIFHVANSITVLAWKTLNLSEWIWNLVEESNTLKLDWLGEIETMNCHFLVVSKTSFVLVVADFFPRSDDWLVKCKCNLCKHIFILILFWFWWDATDLVMWLWSGFIPCRMLNKILKRISMNMNKFIMSFFLLKIKLKL